MLVLLSRTAWAWIITANVGISGEWVVCLGSRRDFCRNKTQRTAIDIIAIIIAREGIYMRRQKVGQLR